MKDLVNIIANNEDIITALHDDGAYWRYMSTATPLAKGGSGEAFLFNDETVLKKQPLDMTRPPYVRRGRCILVHHSFILEAVVMARVSKLSVLVPQVMNVVIGREQGKLFSLLVMRRQRGLSYLKAIKTMSFRERCTLWSHFFEDMRLVFNSTRFLHGDLTTDNMLVDHGRIRLLDFGLSCVAVDGYLFLRYHVARRMATLLETDQITLARIRSIDVCKVLYREKGFSSAFQKLLDTCTGVTSTGAPCRRSLKHGVFPNPVYVHSPSLTYDRALRELETHIGR
jgi:serine/threonine protein kinase